MINLKKRNFQKALRSGALLARVKDVRKRASLKILEMKKIFCLNTRYDAENE